MTAGVLSPEIEPLHAATSMEAATTGRRCLIMVLLLSGVADSFGLLLAAVAFGEADTGDCFASHVLDHLTPPLIQP